MLTHSYGQWPFQRRYIAQKIQTPAASASRIDEDVIQFTGAFAEDIQYLIKLRGEEIQRCPGAVRETTRMNDEGRSDKSPTKKKGRCHRSRKDVMRIILKNFYVMGNLQLMMEWSLCLLYID
jgi:hypothetical protein